jgi:predicted Rossmann fold nucleotide-binding protein DprA/Smf involved in DNA uptake
LPDILDNLGPLPEQAMLPDARQTPADADVVAKDEGRLPVDLTERQRSILDGLGKDPTDVDGVMARTDLDAGVVLQELTVLSLRGLVKRVDGQSYVRR